jgi:flagellar biosynthetic protein FlhB
MDQEERTAPPTERRRRQAREQGLGPRSQDLSLACRLLGIAAALQFCGSTLFLGLADLISEAFQQELSQHPSAESMVSGLTNSAAGIALNSALFVAWIVGSSIIARLAQVGFRIDVSEMTPDINRISPTTGFQKLLRLENSGLSLIQLVKFLLLISIGCSFVWSHLGQLLSLADEDIADGCRISGSLLLSLTWTLAVVQLAVGAMDYGWQYWKFEQSLKMTPDEVRQEQRSRGS